MKKRFMKSDLSRESRGIDLLNDISCFVTTVCLFCLLAVPRLQIALASYESGSPPFAIVRSSTGLTWSWLGHAAGVSAVECAARTMSHFSCSSQS